jgi:Predicted signaling protein consisting of a modified GGDEF domain and a DHH domain
MLKCKKQVFVIGHKNPDMDSVSSAIGYAYLKSTIDKKMSTFRPGLET